MAYQSRDYNISLVAGVEFELRGIIGKFYRLKSVSVPGETISIEFNSSGSFSPMHEGDWGELPIYDTIRLLSAVNVSILLYLGTQMQRSDSSSTQIANLTVSQQINNGGISPLDIPIGIGLSATISGARATKRQTIISNPSTNTSNFRVGVTVSATSGFVLEPGMSIGLDGSMKIDAFNAGVVIEALAVTEIDRI